MQPAAQKVADNAEPVAEDIIKKVIDPAVKVSHALTQQHGCHTELHWWQCFHSCCTAAVPGMRAQQSSHSMLHRAAWQPL